MVGLARHAAHFLVALRPPHQRHVDPDPVHLPLHVHLSYGEVRLAMETEPKNLTHTRLGTFPWLSAPEFDGKIAKCPTNFMRIVPQICGTFRFVEHSAGDAYLTPYGAEPRQRAHFHLTGFSGLHQNLIRTASGL